MKKKSKRWTFIVIGNNRQLGTFDITETSVVTLLVVVLLLASAAFAAFLIHDRRQADATAEISRQLAEAQTALSATENINARFAAHIKNLEARLTTTSSEKTRPEAESVPSPPAPAPTPAIEEPAVETVTEEQPAPEITTVDISHFTIRRRNKDSISYSFRVNNVDTGNDPVSGYTFAILKSNPLDIASWIINPRTPLVKGLPQHFKTGEYFLIHRYKTTRGRFEDIPADMEPSIITILVFSSDGKLILKKDHNI